MQQTTQARSSAVRTFASNSPIRMEGLSLNSPRLFHQPKAAGAVIAEEGTVLGDHFTMVGVQWLRNPTETKTMAMAMAKTGARIHRAS
jgi:hypothetical protein